jgi:hypothetical protein
VTEAIAVSEEHWSRSAVTDIRVVVSVLLHTSFAN